MMGEVFEPVGVDHEVHIRSLQEELGAAWVQQNILDAKIEKAVKALNITGGISEKFEAVKAALLG